ncbi:MAG: hypothetical protein ACD_3C00054G0004 [uncultured bacterium (gcode 4)]|uniref:PHP domain-containing protein n=1 Tax=uncultured bacterium (gcode 4) TaxID=1234023 RepID=K2GDW9_9BACT|nr:MAG: hypothetical protein ACD_3C00054G0004 [uncultured bacterium (gcode 4)]
MKILNSKEEDYHIHSFEYSDWMSSIDEIIRFSKEIWLKKIAITDHCQATLDFLHIPKKTLRSFVSARWSNVWNDVEVTFWVEWDLINEAWDICNHIQEKTWDFMILSAHFNIYKWNPKDINKAYENAIIRHHKDIKFIWHPCMKAWWDHLDIEKLITVANEYDLPMEFNCSNYVNWKTDLDKLDKMLNRAKYLYVNSDAHTLSELRDNKKIWYDFLKNNYGYNLW